ncbi:MAG: UDP-N-acetylmuramate dehydrogenase [Bacteroidales bacterium]|nr:UDP-N-acetylmuramate dehydrogenase [Bacteroidales bacterium]
MEIKENYSLKALNTFNIDVNARYFVEINSVFEIKTLLSSKEFKNNRFLLLGGGSNILFINDFDGIVVKINMKGTEIIKEDEKYIYVKAYAGEVWDEFVNYCIANNYAGLENLSLIPGNVGSSPIQNIGAYGIELKDVFYKLNAINIKTGEQKIFKKDECDFEYRSSIFKTNLKNQYIIESVCFQLYKKPVFKIKYGDIKKELNEMAIEELSIKAVSRAICNIRNKKLPDTKKIGNAGSFFKNPLVSKAKFYDIKNKFPDIVAFEQALNKYKFAAGWLIEQCGWKGKRIGDAGVHKLQSLVLVNYGNASGMEILALANDLQQTVKKKFGV